jgi:peptidyl-prolyl cis-trans isomerase D
VSVSVARPYVEQILKNKKKAEKIKAKMTGSSLEAIAKAVGGTVQQASDLTMENVMLPNVGPEPEVVGNAFALAANKMSAPIEGNTGIYVVKNISTVKAPAISDFKPYIGKLDGQKAAETNRVIPALKGNAKIEDNRQQFNY